MLKTYPQNTSTVDFFQRFWVFTLLLFLSSSTLGQSQTFWEPVFKTFTSHDGLPSMETYCTMQDSKGYLWVGTDHGAARYNGESFTVFTVEDGLKSNTVYDIIEDKKGRIWFFSNTPKLFYLEKGEIKPFAHNDKLSDHISVFAKYFNPEIDDQGILASTFELGSFRINFEGSIRFYQNDLVQSKGTSIQLVKRGNKIVHSVFNTDVSIMIGNNRPCVFEDGNRTFSESIDVGSQLFTGSNAKGTISYIASRYNIWIVTENHSAVSFFERDILYAKFIDDYLWISFRNGGVKQFSIDEDGRLAQVRHLFKHESINWVYQLRDRSYWFNMYQNGLIKIQDFSVNKLNSVNQEISILSIAKKGDQLFTCSSDNQVKVLDLRSMSYNVEKKFEGVSNVLSTSDDRVLLIMTRKKKSLYGDLLNNYTYYFENNPPVFIDTVTVRAPYCILPMNEGFSIGTEYGFHQVKDNKESSYRIIGGIRTMAFINDSTIWASNFSGTFKYRLKTQVQSKSIYPQLTERATDICKVEDDFYFAIHGDGIWKLSENLSHYSVKNGLSRNFISKIIHVKGSLFWLISDTGISLVELSDESAKVISDFNTRDLMCEKINDCIYRDNRLYIGTNKGLRFIDETYGLNKINHINLFFTSTLVKKTPTNIDQLQFGYNENDVVINYDAVSFSSQPVKFRYRIKKNADWIETNERSLQLLNLPAGSYDVEIQSSLNSTDWGNTISTNFSILPPFWMSWWFLISLTLLFLAIVILIFNWQIRAIISKNAKIKRLGELQQIALTQQLNPHFVFNAMGSLQNSILKGNIEKANQYIVGFSKFLRSGLDASRAELISLDKEIELMNRYLNLERSRIGDKLYYEVICQGTANPSEIMITPFVAQPFIENSIKHGISTKSSGEIIVIYKVDGDTLHCTVRDDGIGLKSSHEESKSYGSKIAFERIDLINKLYNKSSKNSIENIIDHQGDILGVIVKFNLPIIYKNAKGNNS